MFCEMSRMSLAPCTKSDSITVYSTAARQQVVDLGDN